ncbi:MAG: hypothetical protein MJY91_06235 [Bacteroidales bacterium]|nr:hypothetical protein [Bacteroidales bacterium]
MRKARILLAAMSALLMAAAANAQVMVQKGDFSVGAQFAHLKLDSDNSEIMLLVNPVSAQGKISQFSPFFEYTYKDDCSFGARVQYFSGAAVLDNITIDLLSEGLSFDLSNLNTHMKRIGASVFHRNYFALDPRSRVGIIADESLSFSEGRIEYDNSKPGMNYSTSGKLNFAFSPGLVFYVMNRVSAMLTISMANVSYNTVKCYTDGSESGGRSKFAARFGIDLTGINFGVAFHFKR